MILWWELLWELLTQTVMRRYGIESPYEKLKDLTRGNRVTKEGMQVFVENLELPEEAKDELLELTPFSYIGNAEEMAKKAWYKKREKRNITKIYVCV